MENSVQTDQAMSEPNYGVERFFADQDPVGRKVLIRYPHAWRPPTDLYETEEAFVARIEIAGMKESSLSVSIADRELTVLGVRQNQDPRAPYHRMEIMYGEFHVHVRLPTIVDETRVEASYADGFLTVKMPKRRVHRVEVVPTRSSRGSEE